MKSVALRISKVKSLVLEFFFLRAVCTRSKIDERRRSFAIHAEENTMEIHVLFHEITLNRAFIVRHTVGVTVNYDDLTR